ncbi:centrosome-associated protein 350-like isoform X1 [Biomphalaria pfeifferi]|uniref:Centrosome-associated protein 350-like isoform X1 n=1 Tax=Biomphalaria pfeifferi TaxID=112525 RepID=A0AAD8B3P1_BIOPF|nr:centrosome-associated protein 350-like isoform X1 [Biomphalaria pfeifferi]
MDNFEESCLCPMGRLASVDPQPADWTRPYSTNEVCKEDDPLIQSFKIGTDQVTEEDEVDNFFLPQENKARQPKSPESDQGDESVHSASLNAHIDLDLDLDHPLTTKPDQVQSWDTTSLGSPHSRVPSHDRADPTEENISTLLDHFLQDDADGAHREGMLADKTETTDGATSTPAPSSALCKYRWSKTINTKSSEVGFYSSLATGEAVSLKWDENSQAYYSDNVRITCGDHQGSLVVDGNIYPVEEFSVKSYTFEVDLYMKDDVLNENVINVDRKLITGNSPSLISNQETNSNTKYEDLVWQHLGGRDKMNSTVDGMEPQPYLSSMKRDSPIGDVDSGKFYEFSSVRTNFDKEKSDKYTDGLKQHRRDSVEKTYSTDSEVKKYDLVEDILSRPPSVPLSRNGEITTLKRANSFSGSRSSSGTPALYNTQPETANQNFNNDPMSLSNIPFATLRSESRTELSNFDIGKQSPLPEQRISPSQSQMPARDISASQWSKSPSGRSTPQKELLVDPVKQYPERTSSQLSSRPPSNANSRSTSRTTSVISMGSEQELAQYMTNNIRDKPMTMGSSSLTNDFLKDSLITRGEDRAASLPNYQQQQQSFKLDGRSVTPDNKIRVPPTDISTFRNGLVTERMEDVLGRASSQSSISTVSRGSSRNATPVASDYGVRDANAVKILELEASVNNLRKLLTNRETEVHSLAAQVADLKDINRSLREDLEHKSQRQTPTSIVQDSLEYKQLQREKEILAGEIVILRDQVERLGRGHQNSGSGRNSVSSGITDYSPNSPHVLQRKIADMEAHMKDLQEVTESTTASLVRAEEKLKHLEEENRELRARNSGHFDIQGSNDILNLRVEMRALREDYRSLKERNLQLTEENMRLLEGKEPKHKDRDHVSTNGSKSSSTYKSDLGSRHVQDYIHSNYKVEQAEPTLSLGTDKSSYFNSSTSRNVSDRESRQPTHTHSYETDRKYSDPNRLLQQRNTIESTRLRPQAKDTKPSDYLKHGLSYPDRSRPDGEVSEKLYTDKYLKRSDDHRDKEVTSSYLDKHYAALKEGELASDVCHRDSYEDKPKEIKYKYRQDSSTDVDVRLSSKQLAGPINSKDIFLNLQQSRTRKWLNEVDSGSQKGKETPEYDSDSTEALVTGLGKVATFHSKCGYEIPEKKADMVASSITLIPKKDLTNSLFTNENKYISGNLDFNRSQAVSTRHTDDTGNDSDTATDILLAQDTIARGTSQRRPSLGSDGTSSTLSDADEDSSLRRRSKSVETSRSKDSTFNRLLSSLPRGTPTARSVTSLDSMRASAGFRSVIPAPLVTQHNKGELAPKNVTSLLNSSLTQGLRPFAPRSIADIRNEDVVKFSRVGGKLTQGVVKYVGHLPGRSEAYLGVELDKDEGKHDGTFEGIRYFKCKPNKGVFVAFNKVVMAWAP